MTAQRARIAEGGRLVIPAEFRRALALRPGESVVMDIKDGELRVRSMGQAAARAQALLRQWVGGANLADALIADRRSEAAHD
jgi:AbrB family looped-hinge helix DNA binding protein